MFFLSQEVSNLWETTSTRFPTFETTVAGLDHARSLSVGENCWNVNHFKQHIKKVALADISDSHMAIM